MAEEINIHVATDLNTDKLPIKTVNNISPDSNGNIAITSVNSATNAMKAVNSDYATSSIKATQDSAGQQINKTYIKELSVSGRTITYKRGDNTTGTITTQDTNTTYSKLSQFTNDSGFITSSGSCANATNATNATNAVNATNATQASYSNQLQAFTGDDFTGGNYFVKAIRNSSNWSTRLWMCYNGGAKTSNEISVAYADSAGSANSVAWANVTGRPSIPTTPNAYVTATWRSGSNWYRKWSNGFIEQGGTVWNSGAWETINLHLAFSDTNYKVTTGTYHNQTNQNGLVTLCSKTTTTFQAGSKWDLGFKPTYVDWYACGY